MIKQIRYMKRLYSYILMSFLTFISINVKAQRIALTTNMLYDAVGVASLGAELKTSKHSSLSLMGTYNPLKYGGAKYKNFSVQPEYRHWFHRTFTGPFVSANIVWGGFNIDKLHIGGLYGKHRQGHFAGVGVGAGYHLILNHRLSLDFTLSGDFVKTRYDRYREGNLPYREGKFNSYAILPIGTGISLAVML